MDSNNTPSKTIARNIRYSVRDIWQWAIGNDYLREGYIVYLAELESRELATYLGSDENKIDISTKQGKVKLKEILDDLIEKPIYGIPSRRYIAYMAVMYLAFGSYIPRYFKDYKEAKIWVKKGFIEYREDIKHYFFSFWSRAERQKMQNNSF